MIEDSKVEVCCFIGEAGDERPTCSLDAKWQVDGPGEYGRTFACTSHVGDLLSTAPIYVVVPVGDRTGTPTR